MFTTRLALALSSAALAVALLGVTPLGSAAGSAVDLARDSVGASPATTLKTIRGPRGPRGRPGRAAGGGFPVRWENEAFRASGGLRETVARRVSEDRRAIAAPPARRSRLESVPPARPQPRTSSSRPPGR
jgi:hypothetical protein